MIKKLLCCLLPLIILAGLVSCKKEGKTSVYDKAGNLIATVTDLDDVYASMKNDGRRFYVKSAIDEAIDNIKTAKNCGSDEAKEMLRKESSVYTCFDGQIFDCINKHYKVDGVEKTELGIAITDTEGNLLATFSNSQNDISVKKASPHSAFKPLSVYAPAIDENKACWSTVYFDSAYKTVFSQETGEREWPSNADGKYSMENVTVCDAIKKSLNTVAVKCLSDYGVMKSVAFLQDNFDIKLEEEQKRATMSDADEIIGNIALGSIIEGCSPVDMAGYYQIFANSGNYTKPHCVTEIKDKNGSSLYLYSQTKKRVIKETTSFVMNRLLQNVISSDGTGKEAHLDGISVGGKTGTGDDNEDNWFIGFTPQYVCAVRHGPGKEKNMSPAVFSSVMTAVTEQTENKILNYPSAAGIVQSAYCKESGMLLKFSCKKMDIGYYTEDNIPNMCNMH